MAKFVVRQTMIGTFESIFRRAALEGDKYATDLGCTEVAISYGEFAFLKDTIFRDVEAGSTVTKPEFKVIVRFTITKQDQ